MRQVIFKQPFGVCMGLACLHVVLELPHGMVLGSHGSHLLAATVLVLAAQDKLNHSKVRCK